VEAVAKKKARQFHHDAKPEVAMDGFAEVKLPDSLFKSGTTEGLALKPPFERGQ
jgi:hypothetical protein